MISFICGEVVEATDNRIIVSCGGIGYEVIATAGACASCEVGKTMQVFTHLAVNESQMLLYGFCSRQEREMFLQLLTVSGIGPKLAVTILSGISLRELAIAIVSGDSGRLNLIKGVGKKTSERIILELKEKLQKGLAFVSLGGGDNSEIEAAAATLTALGVKPTEAARMAKDAYAAGMRAEDIVLRALRDKQ